MSVLKATHLDQTSGQATFKSLGLEQVVGGCREQPATCSPRLQQGSAGMEPARVAQMAHAPGQGHAEVTGTT